jgi:hypothetical protein
VGRVWSLGVNSSCELITPDVLIAHGAAPQHGVVTIAQLLAAGLDRNAITYGIRVTTPARTLVDLADVLNHKALTRAVNEAQVLRLITEAELITLLTRYPGRRTSHLTPERGATRSDLEDDFVRFLKRHRLPLPELNQQIAGHEVDAVYPTQHPRHRTRQPPVPHHSARLRKRPRPRC